MADNSLVLLQQEFSVMCLWVVDGSLERRPVSVFFSICEPGLHGLEIAALNQSRTCDMDKQEE